MLFHVICLETGETIKDASGAVQVLQSGQVASELAKSLTEASGKKHQPRPVKDDTWQDREARRLADGTYTRAPWDIGRTWWYRLRKAEAEHHYAHVAIKSPGNIAFTENPEKGAADVQTTMRIGRYLARFYTLDESDVRAFANEFIATYGTLQLKFADTADDIERVYTEGPSSCMSHAASQFDSSCHPTRVYAAGDLAVAYLVSDDDQDHITARALYWPAKKTYGRVYGDEDKLHQLMDAAGCSHSYGFAIGARMLRIMDGANYVVPYVDGVCGASDNGTNLIITDEGDISCKSTNGLSGPVFTCDACGDGMNEDDYSYIDSRDERWCSHCTENSAFYCEIVGETLANADGVLMASGEYWSDRHFDNDGGTCEATGDNYPMDELVALKDGTLWCRKYFNANGRQCAECGECIEADETCCECEEDTPARHATQGRGENPAQAELPLPAVASSNSEIWRTATVGDQVLVIGDRMIPQGWYTVTKVDSEDDNIPLYIGSIGDWVYARHVKNVMSARLSQAFEVA